MSGPDSAARLDAARRELQAAGIRAEVSTAGFSADVLAVAAPTDALAGVAAIADRLRQLGFRYVALEPVPPSR